MMYRQRVLLIDTNILDFAAKITVLEPSQSVQKLLLFRAKKTIRVTSVAWFLFSSLIGVGMQ